MVLSTQIVRVADGLPLAASMDDEEHSNGKELAEPKNLLRQLYKKLNNSVDQRCSIDTGNFIFHYYIEYGVCFLAICDKQYPKKLAFQFLEELQKEFNEKYGSEVGSVARPYAFVKFDTFIQKTKKQYKDTRTTKNLNKLHEDLRDVTGIMTMNIRDALVRGETLDYMADKSEILKENSRKYNKQAKDLNLQALYQKYGPPAIVVSLVLLVLYLRFYWW